MPHDPTAGDASADDGPSPHDVSVEAPVTVLGVDLSASASAAHRKTWITRATVTDGAVALDQPVPARTLPSEPRSRDAVFDALRRTIAEAEPPAVVGLDAPFSLPEPIVAESDWRAFLETVPDTFSDADDFQTTCHRLTKRATGGDRKEIRRRCDGRFDGLCPYNRFVFRITYHALRDLLVPLVRSETAAAWPFQPGAATADRVLLETYPAAVLGSRLAVRSTTYKDAHDDPAFRRAVLDQVLANDAVAVDPHPTATAIRSVVADDAGGDALDSLLAAWAAAAWVRGDRPTADHRAPPSEGFIHY